MPKRKADFLRANEVGAVLAATPSRWRPLFATAIYTGFRKGELLGLRKSDVDLASRLIIVNRSYDRETTKGGSAEAIPIALELMPYLRDAVKASPELLFPDPQGRMLSRHTPLEDVLRRALAQPANDLSNGSQPSAALSQKLLTSASIRVLNPVEGGRLSRRDSRTYSCGVDGT